MALKFVGGIGQTLAGGGVVRTDVEMRRRRRIHATSLDTSGKRR